MQILHKPLTRKVKRKTKHARLRLDSFCTIFCHMYPCCWCFCCSYVISLLNASFFVVSWLSWLSWLSTFREILDITTLPITRFKKTTRHPTAISDRCWCGPLLAKTVKQKLQGLGRLPRGASVARHPKKTGTRKLRSFLSFSLTAGQPKPASFKLRDSEHGDKTRRWKYLPRHIRSISCLLRFSNVVLKLWKHLWRCFQERFLKDVQSLPCQFSRSRTYSVSMPPFQDHPRMTVVLIGVGLGVGFGGIPDGWRMGFPTKVLA